VDDSYLQHLFGWDIQMVGWFIQN